MNRKQLDAYVAHHRLSSTAVNAVLEIVAARPTASDTRHFIVRLLQLAGVLSLATSVVFFVAANWQNFDVSGRFALIQAVIVVSVALAWWRPPPHSFGEYALLMAFIATGALLALFGQTYQTGADLYELFLTWSLFGVPFVAAGQWALLCAAWMLVFDLSLLLYFGGQPQGGWFWTVFSPWHANTALMLVVPAVLNLALWVFAEALKRTRWSTFAPSWIARLALAFAFGFATWAGVDAVALRGQDWIALAVVLGLEVAVAVYAFKARTDVFPLALVAASFIVLGACALGKHAEFDEVGMFFVLALWLVVSSTIGGRVLMWLMRAWRGEEESA